jgi:hypothetical protein
MMAKYEYKVVPAPKKGLKARGVRSNEDRFAHALTTLMNQHASDGWEYLRTDTLPAEERVGFTGRTTVFQNMLIFRRSIEVAIAKPVERQTPILTVVPEPTPEPEIVPVFAHQIEAEKPEVAAE